jgi:Beta-glucosidase (SUN family)
MLIPTSVESWIQLAVPDTSYWCETAAHYYVNPPGITTDVACVWGTSANPWGNWSPYVAGANTDASGNTFIKLGWNPIYLQPATPFNNIMPSWGVEIVCNGAGCNGLPCAIDPTKNGVNEMVGSFTDGAGGAAFCVVTVPPGVSANFVITNSGESSSSSISSSSSSGPISSSISSSSMSMSNLPSSSSSSQFSIPTFTEAQGRAGEFYPTGSSPWPASITASATTLTWTSASTTAHSYANFTSVYAPTNSPYYSLFNHTHTLTSAASGTAETTASALASATEPTIAPSQPPIGSASDMKLPALSFVVSAIAASLAVYL